MLAKTIKYIDLNGQERTETLYFNLSSLEQAKFDAKYTREGCNDFKEYMEKIVKSNNKTKIINFFCDLIETAYMKKSEDGRRFDKSKETLEDFRNSVAYAEFFELLLTDTKAMEDFANGVFSKQDRVTTSSAQIVQ